MKRIAGITVMAFFMAIALLSCKKNDTSSNSNTLQTSAVVTQGTWKITLYNDSGTDETANYTGYTFSFISGGSASAIFGSVVTNGTWNSYNDDSQNKLYLNFGGTAPLAKLKVDWHIIEKTTLKIRLEDVSGGGGGTDYLTFERL